MTSPLCEYCLIIPSTNDSAYHPHHSSATALLASAAGGCSLCTILCDCFQQTPWPTKAGFGNDATKFHFYIENDQLSGKSIPIIFFVVEFENRDMKGVMKWNGKRGTRERFEVYVPILIVPATNPNAVRLRATLDESTESGESWDLANHWLNQCIRTHSKCQQSNQARLPTRLLDVGTSNGPFIRLHLTKGDVSMEKYVTLSHCWGRGDNASRENSKLKETTFNSMQKQIVIDTLPKTFQDAVTITRRMGIRYLWIDSLCIIQGDKDDWARESSMMGSVYQNGYCNIAATSAKDGTVGCFRPRDPFLAQPCRIRLERKLEKFDLSRGSYDLVPRNMLEEALSVSPLLKRAWVVQERVLARRMLHFARNQLFWECEELDACEMYPAGMPSSLVQSNPSDSTVGGQQFGFRNTQFKNLDPSSVRSEVHIIKTPWTFSVIPDLPSGPLIDPYYVWNKIVTAFTKCNITIETDRLAAISALALKVHEMTNDEYLAGLWKRHLPYHLVWATDHRVAPRVETMDGYVAPTWSWASKTRAAAPYVYIRPDYPPMVQILSAKTVLRRTNDPMGQVTGGHIQLRGWLRKFRVTTPKRPVELFQLPDVSEAVEFDEILPPGELDVWFLPVISLGPWMTFEALGLLLEETANEGEFRRVGRFRALEDVAKKFFRRPTYPPDSGNCQAVDEQTTSAVQQDRRERRGWFGAKKIKNEESVWKEKVITII